MKKKLLLFFALIATFVCLFAITSSATEVDGIYYTFTKTDTYENYAGTATVNTNNRTKGKLTDVKIPETVEYDKDGDGIKEKYVVTAIDSQAFGANGGSSSPIVSVYVPKTVASIGTHAFRQLKYLETVTIDACGYNLETEETSKVTFSNAEFLGCSTLTTVDMSKSNVTTVGGYAFQDCSALESVEFSKNIESLGYRSFKGCKVLSSISSLETVKTIGGEAFQNAIFGGEIKLNSITSLGNNAFQACVNITSVDMTGATLEKIGDYAFNGCSLLETVNISSSVKTVGNGAFQDCKVLESVGVLDNVTSIGGSAFKNCSALTSVGSLANVTSIGGSAFQSCSSIEQDIKLNSLTSIGSNAFQACSKITAVDMGGTSLTEIASWSFQSCYALTTVVLPDNLEKLGQDAFAYCPITSINIPSSITYFDTGCFRSCKFDGDIVINNLETIGNHAFRETNITSVTILDGTVTSIGSNAEFNSCKNLEFVVLPDSVTTIGKWVFTGCSSLKYIVASENITSVELSSGSGIPSTLKAIILRGNDQDKLNAAATAFGGTLASFATYDPEAYPSSRTVYYGVDTKDSVNYYQIDGLDKAWCEWNATTNVKTNYAPVAEALGYSIKEDGDVSDGIIAGFKLDPVSREAYEKYFGKITLGVFVANAGKFTGNDFIADGKITNTFGVQLEITQRDYHKVNCTVVGMSEATDVPPLAYALYALDAEGNVLAYIQKNDYASGTFANVATAGENTLIAVTLAEVEALISKQ